MDTSALDYLLRLAALAVAFVAFATIVVTLQRALGGELSALHMFLVRSYIEIQLLVAVLAVLPSLLNLFALPSTLIWQVSSATVGTSAPAVLLTFIRGRARVPRYATPAREYVIWALALVAVAGLWLNVAGVGLPPSGGPYAVALTWFLFSTGFVFLRGLGELLHSQGA